MNIQATRAQYISWKEYLSNIDAEAEMDYEGFDALLESLDGGEGGVVSARVPVQRVPTPTPYFRRGSEPVKTASRGGWDSDYNKAQAHARDVLENLGNSR